MTDDANGKILDNPHKVFVGGISYRMDETGLRECKKGYSSGIFRICASNADRFLCPCRQCLTSTTQTRL